MFKALESESVVNVIRLHNNIQKRMGRALSVHGIGLTEYLVLNQLYNTATQKMQRSDLAEQIGLSPSGVTRLINPMEKIGLVVKEDNPRDARVSLVALTLAGKQVYEEAQVTFSYTSVAQFELFESNQLSSFSELLKIVS